MNPPHPRPPRQHHRRRLHHPHPRNLHLHPLNLRLKLIPSFMKKLFHDTLIRILQENCRYCNLKLKIFRFVLMRAFIVL